MKQSKLHDRSRCSQRLEKIEMVRRGNGHYRLDHAVTKKQKTLLSAFGLSDTDVKSIAIEIGMSVIRQFKHLQTKRPRRMTIMARTRSLSSIETEISKVTAELQKAQEKVDELTQRLLELQEKM